MTVQKLAYLPHLDGLRSLALVHVLFFHFHVFNAHGGYLGVDIFLALSGFLMTRIILRDITAGTFSLRAFMIRRFWRLYPALLVTTAATRAAAVLLFSKQLRSEVDKSAFASLAFSSNIYFLRTTRYFGVSSDLKPLLHTWSLSLEEQFYLFWPLFLLLAVRYLGDARRRIALAVCAVTALSFSVAVASSRFTSFVFFSLPTRIFEFTAGGVVALFYPVLSDMFRNRAVSNTAAAAGLFIVSYPVFNPPSSNSPGPSSLATLVGTALLMVTPTSAIAQRLLAAPAVRYVAKLSYSAYLVHWPLWVFGSFVNGGPMADKISVFVATFVLAYALYAGVENPCRESGGGKHGPAKSNDHLPLDFSSKPAYGARLALLLPGSLKRVFIFALLAGTLAATFGAAMFGGFRQARKYVASERYNAAKCHWIPLQHQIFKPLNGRPAPLMCLIGAPPRVGHPMHISRILVGSSFAKHLVPTMRLLSLWRNESILVMHGVDCPFIADPLHTVEHAKQSCREENKRRVEMLRILPPAPVIVSDKMSGRFFDMKLINFDYDSARGAHQYFRSLATTLGAMGRNMTVVGEPPVFDERRFERIRSCNGPRTRRAWRLLGRLWGRGISCPTELPLDWRQNEFHEKMTKFFNTDPAMAGVKFVNLIPGFCNMKVRPRERTCFVKFNSLANIVAPTGAQLESDEPHYYYFEGIHLSEIGAWQLAPLLSKVLG